MDALDPQARGGDLDSLILPRIVSSYVHLVRALNSLQRAMQISPLPISAMTWKRQEANEEETMFTGVWWKTEHMRMRRVHGL